MKKSILHCTVISPMFSYGNQKVELRPSELKGLMRYIYRIANHQSRTELLYEAEGKRFGDAEKYASPVRMQMKMLDEKQVRQSLMLHKEAPDRNPRMLNFSAGTTFEIIIRTLSGTDIEGITHECYKDHVILSLVLGGLGKRTRRGRGCVTIAELNKNNQQLLFWVTEQLNTINEKNSSGGTPPYKNEKGEIVVAADLTKLQRPIIEKLNWEKRLKISMCSCNQWTKLPITSNDIRLNVFKIGNTQQGLPLVDVLLLLLLSVLPKPATVSFRSILT